MSLITEQNKEIDESVGPEFSTELLKGARDITLKVIEEAKAHLRPGITEEELKSKIEQIQENLNIEKAWHKPQIRFGKNTTLPFGVPGIKNNKLREDDIVFLDLGLVYKSHEGDVGRAYSVGNNDLMKKCCLDVETIWQETQKHWKETKATGEELYAYATELAHNLGWKLAKKQANGHRISDFPHIVRNRKTSIDELTKSPQENRWILEIQITAPNNSFGAFYEDLMN